MVFEKSAATIFWEKSPLLKAITIKAVHGGQDTNPLWTSQVDNSSFRHALEASFKNHDLLSGAPASAKLGLTVNLRKMVQPFGGFDMTVTSDIQYLLVRRRDSSKAGGFIVLAPYTATFGDAAVAPCLKPFAHVVILTVHTVPQLPRMFDRSLTVI